MEDDDDQKRPERVTNDSYPDNVDVTAPIQQVMINLPIKGLQTVLYIPHLVEMVGNSERERRNVLIWAGDLTPDNPHIK